MPFHDVQYIRDEILYDFTYIDQNLFLLWGFGESLFVYCAESRFTCYLFLLC